MDILDMNVLANVKITKKRALEELQARLLLFQQKMTQQELLDRIIEYTHQHFDDFLKEQFPDRTLTTDKCARIKKMVYTGEIRFPDKSNDELLYGEEHP
jgi:iron-sulfur cluster repair protein YtfE (RIC family)